MAKGSHASWGEHDSRVCLICGKPITLTGKNANSDVWAHYDAHTDEHRTVHTKCGSPLKRP